VCIGHCFLLSLYILILRQDIPGVKGFYRGKRLLTGVDRGENAYFINIKATLKSNQVIILKAMIRTIRAEITIRIPAGVGAQTGEAKS
jgi:hypothetical protein